MIFDATDVIERSVLRPDDAAHVGMELLDDGQEYP